MLHVLLKAFFKTVKKLLHPLTVHPKLMFWEATRKTLMVPENRPYQMQYFAKIFPSSLALMLIFFFIFSYRNHLEMHFEQSEL